MKKRTMRCVVIIVALLFPIVGCSTDQNIKTVNIGNVPPAQNFIENSSVEISDESDPNMPDNWSNNCWGNNETTFTYLNDGYSGRGSIKIDVADYIDGDAKWFPAPVELAAGDYVFSSYYRSDVDTRVVVVAATHSGDIAYIDLPDAPASADWTKYESSFIMPESADTATVYHLLSRDGYLVTDDYQINPYHFEGFDRGLVTITFDDGWEENTKTALPIMQEFGYKSNQFYATAFIENPRVPNPRELIQLFIDAGHEIGSHSVTHPYLTALSEQEVTAELSNSKAFLEKYLGVGILYFATPYGAYNTSVNESIMTYYDAHRTAVESGYNSKDNFDASRLKSQSCLSCTTSTEFESWVKKAKDERLWLILLYHRITDDPSDYDTTPEMFREHMQRIKDADLPVVTFSQAIAELEG